MTGDVVVATADPFLRLALETTLRASGRFRDAVHVRDPRDLAARAAEPGTLVLLCGDLAARVDLRALAPGRVLLVEAGGGELPACDLPVLPARREGGLDVVRLRSQLLQAIDALARDVRPSGPPSGARVTSSPPAGRPTLLVFGASTGSLEPLIEILASGPLALPALIAIHMPADQTAALAAHLSRETGRPVSEAVGGPLPAPGSVAVLRGGANFELLQAGCEAMLRQSASAPGPYRPNIDLLLRSAAEAGLCCDAVILSGMGSDGAAGAAAIERTGGRVFVQLPETCVVAGMPAAALAACRAARAHAPAALASRLRHPASASIPASAS